MTKQTLEEDNLLLPEEKVQNQLPFPANSKPEINENLNATDTIDTKEINFNYCKYLLSIHYKQYLREFMIQNQDIKQQVEV